MQNAVVIPDGTRQKHLAAKYGGRFRMGNPDRKSSSEYKFGSVVQGVDAVALPFSDDFGGIEGSNNPYGYIAPGQTFRPQGTETFVAQESFSLNPNMEKVAEEPPKAVEGVSPDVQQALQSLAFGAPVTDTPTFSGPVFPEIQVDKVKVRIEGSGGTFSGKYVNVVETNKLLVLCYDVDDNIYTPPDNQEPLRLAWGSRDLKAFYSGISYELEFLHLGFQVFIPAG